MVRHTGDYLLGTMFLAAALILQLSQAGVDSAATSPLLQAATSPLLQSVAKPAMSEASSSGMSSGPSSPLHGTPSGAVKAVLCNLPRGTRIVVGSLDLSGARHQIRLMAQNDDSSSNVSIAVARFTTESIRPFHNPASMRALAHRARSGRDHQLIQTAAFELQPADTKCLSNISNAVYRPTIDKIAESDGSINTIETSTTSTAEDQRSARVFLMPHFCDSGTVHKPGECRTIGENHRIRVYADKSLLQTSSAHLMQNWCELLISAVELEALPTVETWIGPICDIDGDKKLSIVVTDLDQFRTVSVPQAPIFGCIRETDFCSESDFCGDIVYIDQHIFELPLAEVCGLLSHEIAHAAICSIIHQGTVQKSTNPQRKTPFFAELSSASVQPWLNEAVAHFIELQCRDEAGSSPHTRPELFTKNFQSRVDAFLASSNVSPIVASENVLDFEERRNGSRGAATLFLAPLILTPDDLQTLICSDDSLQARIENLAQEPFADVFKSWTLAVASSDHDTNCLCVEKIESTLESQHRSILGTAFQCFECSDDIETLVLTSDESAQLQVSIIEPAVQHGHIARAGIGQRGTSVP